MKKIALLLTILTLCALFAGCGAQYAPNVSAPEDATAEIGDYLSEVDSYFNVLNINAAKAQATSEGKTGNDAFALLVELTTKKDDLPEGLVNSYVSAIQSAENSTVSGEDATAMAKAMIKEEMVVYAAYNSMWSEYAINNAMRREAAKSLGGTFTEGLSEGEYYIYDSFIMQQVITAYLSGEEIPYISLATTESGEETSADSVADSSAQA